MTSNEYTNNYRKNHPWIVIYSNLKNRCENPKNPRFKDYGGKGIKNLFKGPKDIKYLYIRDKASLMKQPSIDREDNNGDYCIENCRFIEMDVNRIKDRCKSVLQFDLNNNFIKEWKSLTEASLHYKVNHAAIFKAIKNSKATSCGSIWKYKNE
jgi:hypothetical protein